MATILRADNIDLLKMYLLCFAYYQTLRIISFLKIFLDYILFYIAMNFLLFSSGPPLLNFSCTLVITPF